jgi:membrane protein DedA with SNARE-associated domain
VPRGALRRHPSREVRTLHAHALTTVMHFRRALAELPPRYAYAALFGILLFEGTGLPLVPFEPLFLATAYLIAHRQMHLLPVVVYGAGGDLLGNIIGYHVGRTVGQLLLDRYGPLLRLDAGRMESTRAWFWRFGGGTLFIGRFFGPIRTPAILLAGVSRMPIWSYVAWLGVADALWVGAWQLVLIHTGHLAIGVWDRVGFRAGAIAFLLLLVAAAVVWWRWRTRGGWGHA